MPLSTAAAVCQDPARETLQTAAVITYVTSLRTVVLKQMIMSFRIIQHSVIKLQNLVTVICYKPNLMYSIITST